MNIQGLQKLTLLDYPEHVAATLFTGGCQLNCPYCHNSELISGPFGPGEDTDAVLAFLKKRQALLDGVCVSGGEPLLQPDIADFLRAVKALGYQIKLDTNGGFPEKARRHRRRKPRRLRCHGYQKHTRRAILRPSACQIST